MRHNARFRRLYAATAASDLADGIGRVALPLAAAGYTRDPFLVSGLVTFAFLPWLLFALPSGALVDRIDRRFAMALANGVRAVASVALTILVLCDVGGIVALYAIAFALGVAETIYDSAVRAILPQLLRPDQLDQGNSLLTVEETLGQTFVGAPLGSALYGVAIALPFLTNAIGFALAVALILTLRGTFRPQRPETVTSVRADIAEGVRWLRGHALLRGLTLISAGTSLAQSMTSGVLVLYALEVLRLPDSAFGLLLLAAGGGALIGGLSTPPLARRFGRPVVLTTGSILAAGSLGLMSCTRNPFVAGALFASSAAGVMAWNVLTMSLRQTLIPEGLFGRVQGAYRTLVWGAIPLGSLVGGLAARGLGIRGVFALAGAAGLVLSVLLGRLLHRHRDSLIDTEPAGADAAVR